MSFSLSQTAISAAARAATTAAGLGSRRCPTPPAAPSRFGRRALVVAMAKGSGKSKMQRPVTAAPKRQGKGFGRSAEENANADLQHLLPLSPEEAAKGVSYFLFVRAKAGGEGSEEAGKWVPLGDMTINSVDDLRPALQERQDILVEFGRKDSMALRVALGKRGRENYEFGYRIQKGPAPEDGDMQAIRLVEDLDTGTEVGASVPARVKLLESGASKAPLPQGQGMEDQVELARRLGDLEGVMDRAKN